MSRKRWLAVFGLVAAAGATGCRDNQARQYLTKLYPYLEGLSKAVCQLEEKNPTGLDPLLRTCPGGPGDRKQVPPYPP